jgi:hypothetical protein
MFGKSIMMVARRRGWLPAASLVAAIVVQFAFADLGTAAPITTACGSLVSSTVKTNIGAALFQSTTFAVVPGANTTVSVPPGQSRCVKVTFTASTSCTNGTNSCFIVARDSGTLMNPANPFRAIDADSGIQNAAHSLEWVRRIGAGNHAISVQVRVSSADTDFQIADWTMDVQVLN